MLTVAFTREEIFWSGALVLTYNPAVLSFDGAQQMFNGLQYSPAPANRQIHVVESGEGRVVFALYRGAWNAVFASQTFNFRVLAEGPLQLEATLVDFVTQWGRPAAAELTADLPEETLHKDNLPTAGLTAPLALPEEDSRFKVLPEFVQVDTGLTVCALLDAADNADAVLYNSKGKAKDGAAKVGTGDTLETRYMGYTVHGLLFCVHGDPSGDGETTADDARLTLRRSVGLEAFTDLQTAAADMDGNGSIDADDARTLLRLSVGLE